MKKYIKIPSGHYYCRYRFNSKFFIQESNRNLSDGRYWVGQPAEFEFFEIDVE